MENTVNNKNTEQDMPGEVDAFKQIIGNSPALMAAIDLAKRAAPHDVTVLITGETGTGKELVARAIRDASPRRDSIFIPRNCAEISETLGESDLFGHVPGAFTGATKLKLGIFKVGNNGTIFLDEIGKLPLFIQPKLLRVLEDGSFMPVGSVKTEESKARIIAATNRDLKAMVSKGEFLEDLFYRLAVIPIQLPSLRERGSGDIDILAKAFIAQFNKKLSPSALSRLGHYSWPGNVRELWNVVKRVAIMTISSEITGEDIDAAFAMSGAKSNGVIYPCPTKNGFVLKDAVHEFELSHIKNALQKSRGNVTQAANSLKLSQSCLDAKIKQQFPELKSLIRALKHS
jgi:transcriptional regulator with PAS, ATPase and Fis domain